MRIDLKLSILVAFAFSIGVLATPPATPPPHDDIRDGISVAPANNLADSEEAVLKELSEKANKAEAAYQRAQVQYVGLPEEERRSFMPFLNEAHSRIQIAKRNLELYQQLARILRRDGVKALDFDAKKPLGLAKARLSLGKEVVQGKADPTQLPFYLNSKNEVEPTTEEILAGQRELQRKIYGVELLLERQDAKKKEIERSE